MIAAGFLPACTAAWHRGAFELVRAGVWQDLPGATGWPPDLWLAAPALIVATLAIVAAAAARVRALLVVLGLSSLVQPWLPVVLLPLVAATKNRPDWRNVRGAAAVGMLTWLAGVWLVPPCEPAVSSASLPAADVLRALWAVVSLPGAALLAFDAAFNRHERRHQLAALAALLAAGALTVTGVSDDPAALLGAAAAVLAWRMTAGARWIVRWQTTPAGRVGAGALILLVPLLAVARIHPPSTNDPETAAVWAALEAAGSPAAIMRTGGRADTATTIWRSGASAAQRTLVSISPDDEAARPFLPSTAVYAWSSVARTVSMRGMLVAPVRVPEAPDPLLWRVLHVEPCSALTSAWMGATATAAAGQLTGRFPVADPNKGVLLYLGSDRALRPAPLDWPPEARQGFDARPFDRATPDGLAAFTDAIQRDELPADALGESRFVTRLRFDRRGTAPEALAITLGGIATAAWARLYATTDARPDHLPSLCRNNAGQVVAAYAGAPTVLSLEINSPHVAGGGWHAVETSGPNRFRWTTDAADLFFIAHRPEPLLLRIEAQPGTGDWATAGMRVALNGVETRCDEGAPPCAWRLPAEAMRTGLNVITLHSEAVDAPAPDPRRLGLMVHAAELSRP